MGLPLLLAALAADKILKASGSARCPLLVKATLPVHVVVLLLFVIEQRQRGDFSLLQKNNIIWQISKTAN